MKILHVIPGVEEATNGIAVAAKRIAAEQRRLGHVVACAERFAREDYRSADLVFVHSCWTPTVWRGCWGAIRAGRRLVRMTHACLDPVRLSYHGWKKRLVVPLERWFLRRSDCVLATCVSEQEWIRAYEPRVRRVVVTSLGVDVPGREDIAQRRGDAEKRDGDFESGVRRLLYLGRRHPLKGLDILEDALARLSRSNSIEQSTNRPIVLRQESAIFGEEKALALAECDALVLPTRSENFGLVIAEALAAGKPVIVTDGAPWEGVREKKCGWFVEGFKGESLRFKVQGSRSKGKGMAETGWNREKAVANLKRALEEFAATPREELETMGARGRAWMAQDFGWDKTVERLMKEVE